MGEVSFTLLVGQINCIPRALWYAINFTSSKGIPLLDQNFSKIDPYLKNFLTYHPTFYTPIDRSRRALQLCNGGRGEWVRFRLYFGQLSPFLFCSIKKGES